MKRPVNRSTHNRPWGRGLSASGGCRRVPKGIPKASEGTGGLRNRRKMPLLRGGLREAAEEMIDKHCPPCYRSVRPPKPAGLALLSLDVSFAKTSMFLFFRDFFDNLRARVGFPDPRPSCISRKPFSRLIRLIRT